MQGKKTHEQQKRILERKPDLPDARRIEADMQEAPRDDHVHQAKEGVRDSEFPVSMGGMNQESDHNKHNNPGQEAHKPQRHGPAEEKQ